jgi:hypothetical protein
MFTAVSTLADTVQLTYITLGRYAGLPLEDATRQLMRDLPAACSVLRAAEREKEEH